jgi:hypothetical protein
MPGLPVATFEQALTPAERREVESLATPIEVQSFLDGISYRAESVYCSPLRVLRERRAHCFDGALFAATALRRLGHRPLVLEMIPNDRDDGHMLALYQSDGYWGAVAKSNFAGLRFREPVYRTLRELVMSYFEQYYNVEREKTLRAYSLPLNLEIFDALDWMTRDEPLQIVADRLERTRKIPLLTSKLIARLSLVDERQYEAGLLGANDAGLYRPS